MKTNYKAAIALVAGAAIGGAAIQGLHAQAKPPAYLVIPILKINDAAAYKTGVIDKASATAGEMTAAGNPVSLATISRHLAIAMGRCPFSLSKADIPQRCLDVRFVPKADSGTGAGIRLLDHFIGGG